MNQLDKYFCTFVDCGFSTNDKQKFKEHVGKHLKND